MTVDRVDGAPVFLRAHPDDNLVVIVRDVPAGTEIGTGVVTRQPHRLGQKVAAVRIPTGEPVLRWGTVIGQASGDIEPGELVHDHNVVSNYLRATTRRGDR